MTGLLGEAAPRGSVLSPQVLLKSHLLSGPDSNLILHVKHEYPVSFSLIPSDLTTFSSAQTNAAPQMLHACRDDEDEA